MGPVDRKAFNVNRGFNNKGNLNFADLKDDRKIKICLEN